MNGTIASLSKEIFQLVSKTGKTLSTAESCSAGRIATALTQTPGCSAYFKGGLVSYMDSVKEKFLSVDARLIETETAVCQTVAYQMALGSMKMFQSDFSVAMTGFAGPDGGTEDNPVGTIWMSVGSEHRVVTKKVCYNLGREGNVEAAVKDVLILLRDFLKEEIDK